MTTSSNVGEERGDGGLDRIADLPPGDLRYKEVFTRVGLAMYWAQLFEEGMTNLLVLFALNRKSQDVALARDDIDALFSNYRSSTAGRLLTQLKDDLGGEEKVVLCQQAVCERNRLIHGFFWRHARNFLNEVGCQRMVDEADAIRKVCADAQGVVKKLTDPELARRGISQEQVRAIHERMEARTAQEEEAAF